MQREITTVANVDAVMVRSTQTAGAGLAALWRARQAPVAQRALRLLALSGFVSVLPGLSAVPLLADEPLPPAASVTVSAPGGDYFAVTDPTPPMTRVFASDAPGVLLWSVDRYSRTPFLSPDGRSLLLTLYEGGLVPSNDPSLPVLEIVRSQRKSTITLTLEELSPAASLQRTASHWLLYRRIGWVESSWRVELVDGTECFIDPETGQIRRSR